MAGNFLKYWTFYDKYRQTLIGDGKKLNTLAGCVDFNRQAGSLLS